MRPKSRPAKKGIKTYGGLLGGFTLGPKSRPAKKGIKTGRSRRARRRKSSEKQTRQKGD